MKPRLIRGPFQYWRNLPHFSKADRVHFVTFNTWNKWQMPGACREIVASAFHFHNGNKYDLLAFVVMPEHVHALVIPERGDDGYPLVVSEMMHAIKSYTANQIHKVCPQQRRVWQDESMDHVVRHAESFEQKVEYIRMNPVRRGLVKKPEDYRWLWVKRFERAEFGILRALQLLKNVQGSPIFTIGLEQQMRYMNMMMGTTPCTKDANGNYHGNCGT